MNAENRMLFRLLAAAALGGAVVAGGCAGDANVPAHKITTVERAISEAKTSTATIDAPVELKAAEEGLAAAKAAMAARDYDKASRLADKASADADLAQKMAVTAKSKKMADDVRESVKTLQQEIERTPAK